MDQELVKRLSSIEAKLDVVIRLEERQKSTDESIKRVHLRLDDHGQRIRKCESELGVGGVVSKQNSKTINFMITTIFGLACSVGTGLIVFVLTK